MKKFLEEFKEFAMRGSVIDLAVGVVIGAAFNSIVNSLVKDIITPILSIVIGRINISTLVFTIPPLIKGFPGIAIPYGDFLQAVINFLIISFSIFLVVKLLSRLHKKEAAGKTDEPVLTRSETLLTDIRDLLREKAADGAESSDLQDKL